MTNVELIREAKRINGQVIRLYTEEEVKERNAGTYYKAPDLTVSTPIAILEPDNCKGIQLKNAIRKIAHGINKDEIQLIVDTCSTSSALSYFDINSCRQGIIVTKDKFFNTIMEKGESLISNKKVPMPLIIKDIDTVNIIPDSNSYLRITMKNGTVYDAFVSIYGEFTYRLLDYLTRTAS